MLVITFELELFQNLGDVPFLFFLALDLVEHESAQTQVADEQDETDEPSSDHRRGRDFTRPSPPHHHPGATLVERCFFFNRFGLVFSSKNGARTLRQKRSRPVSTRNINRVDRDTRYHEATKTTRSTAEIHSSRVSRKEEKNEKIFRRKNAFFCGGGGDGGVDRVTCGVRTNTLFWESLRAATTGATRGMMPADPR